MKYFLGEQVLSYAMLLFLQSLSKIIALFEVLD